MSSRDLCRIHVPFDEKRADWLDLFEMVYLRNILLCCIEPWEHMHRQTCLASSRYRILSMDCVVSKRYSLIRRSLTAPALGAGLRAAIPFLLEYCNEKYFKYFRNGKSEDE